MNVRALSFLLLFLGGSCALAPMTTIRSSRCSTSLAAVAGNDRRAFLKNTLLVGGMSTAVFTDINPSYAEESSQFEDLSMPTEEEQKRSEEDAMKARLARKAELQKEMARPMSFNESLKKEKEKQKGLKKSKEEMRAALCEELGRGC